MKSGALIIGCIVFGALLCIAIMVKYATEIRVENSLRTHDDPAKTLYEFTGQMGVISLNKNSSLEMSRRFPYVAAITRNHSNTWAFACFASVILVKWVVTSAHCQMPESTHRVLLYYDFVRNYSHTYPILLWKVHSGFDRSVPFKNDIAIAKLSLQEDFITKSSYINAERAVKVVASVWKTVSTMDNKLFLTNAFEIFDVIIASSDKCLMIYGIKLDESQFCVDLTIYREDCFTNEFGPIYSNDKVVGIMTIKPRDCDNKFAIFTNISYYTTWIVQTADLSVEREIKNNIL